jgi:hypothetical protein
MRSTYGNNFRSKFLYSEWNIVAGFFTDSNPRNPLFRLLVPSDFIHEVLCRSNVLSMKCRVNGNLSTNNIVTTQVEQARSFTTVYGEIRRFTCDRITIVYLHVVYGDIRRKNRSFTVLVHGGRIQSLFSSVYDRIAPYTVTMIYDRNTITCITAKYSRIRSYRERLRPYTELVTVDLGSKYFQNVFFD